MIPTNDILSRLKSFAMEKWRERAAELGQPEPIDLSGACKFCALLAREVFGGSIAAHEFHTWVVLDGEVVDLAEDGRDVAEMRDETTPSSCAEYARVWGIEWEGCDPYSHDPSFAASDDFRESLASCERRVAGWHREWVERTRSGHPAYSLD